MPKVQCTSCQRQCPEGCKFCPACGAQLKIVCGPCGFANEPDGKFCGGCGTSLDAADDGAASPTLRPLPATNEAERRQLTVMFCDLVGSTELSERLDPEDLRDAITTYQDRTAKAIERYGGYIARYMGDGILIYFGYPNAHERDAERAVRAGLDIIAAMHGHHASDGTTLEVRIGAATGMVVAGDIIGSGAAEERAVLGDTPNLAARLQGLAKPGTMVISATTQMLCGQGLRSSNLGEHTLKGIAKPVAAYSADAFKNLSSHHLSPTSASILSGRKEPLNGFSKLWNAARNGRGGAMLIKGEAGIGKSVLLSAYREQVQKDGGGEIVLVGSEFHQDSPLRPFQEYFLAKLKIVTDDDVENKWSSVEQLISTLDLNAEQLCPIIGHVLALPSTDAYPPLNLDGAVLKDKTARALRDIVRAQTEQRPHILIAEDAQWMDASTLDVIELILSDNRARKQIFVVSTRPGLNVAAFEKNLSKTYELDRLDATIARQIVIQIAANAQLQPSQIDNILEHADGVPLFLEEITKSVIEANRDHQDDTDLSIPTTLQDSLMARLDRLGSAKAVAQTAAVIGRVFHRTVLSAITKNDTADLESALLDLVTAGLITPVTAGPAGSFEFKQALIRDAAYQSLLIRTRCDLHRHVADALDAANSQGVHSEPEVIAHHLTAANLPERALPLWTKAARSAAKRWANTEAVSFFNKALTAHRQANPQETSTEVGLLLDMIASMRIIDRFDDAFKALDSAEGLCGKGGPSEELIRIHILRGNLYFPLGNAEGCLKQHTEACRLARDLGRTDLEARALGGIGDALALEGKMSLAEDHYDQSVKICRAHDLPDIETGNLAMRGHMRIYLLRFKDAIEDCHRATALAVDAGNRRSEMVSQGSMLAKVLAEQGQWADAERALLSALDIARTLGALRYLPMYLSLLARIQWATNRKADALVSAKEALTHARKDGMVYTGAMALGAYAKVCDHHQTANDCLKEGMEILTGRIPAHNYLWFHLDAMDTGLAWKDWAVVDHHADTFEAFALPKNIPWAIFHIERCRLLAKVGRDNATENDYARLKIMMEDAKARHQIPALHSIQNAIS